MIHLLNPIFTSLSVGPAAHAADPLQGQEIYGQSIGSSFPPVVVPRELSEML